MRVGTTAIMMEYWIWSMIRRWSFHTVPARTIPTA